ncbi:MAG: VOC family protein [Nevskiales bacterium]
MEMKINLLLCPVSDLEAAVAFYRDTLGWPVKFRDGDRYCAIDAGGFTLGLAAREERIVEEPAPVLEVDDIDQSMAAMVAAGASITRPLEQGPHEARVVLHAPGGGALVLSSKRRQLASQPL